MQLYFVAAKIIGKTECRSIKSHVYNTTVAHKKALYAIICETLRYAEVIKIILEKSGFLRYQKIIRGNLASVLVYEMLFGNGVGKVKDRLPRYVRVNTLKTSLQKVVECFQSEGYNLIVAENGLKHNAYIERVSGLKKGEFLIDIHVDNLLVFAVGTDLHTHHLYTIGQIILQDKASCLPALLLDPGPNSHIIDACAAPGNKTTHLASIVNNTGKIFAIDRDSERIVTMKKLVERAGVSCIDIKKADFLQIDPRSDEYRDVEYILVDPSCSGSGIVSRLDKPGDLVNLSRLKSLSIFQEKILLHAFKFPNVTRVVYSTCSVHTEENELVISRVLNNKSVSGKFQLHDIMPSVWPIRGVECPGLPNASFCIRASAKETLTNGFFVARIDCINYSGNTMHQLPRHIACVKRKKKVKGGNSNKKMKM